MFWIGLIIGLFGGTIISLLVLGLCRAAAMQMPSLDEKP